MRARCLFLLMCSLLVAPARSQDAASLVSTGRVFLAQHDVPNANASFRSAVEAAPNDETANALYAYTRLLSLPADPSVSLLLDRFGFSKTNRDILSWKAKVPRGTNGAPIVPLDLSASEGVELLRTNILREVGAAALNLAHVTSTNFALNLSSNETSVGSVTLDLGDITLLGALMNFGQYVGYTITSWNLDVQLASLRSLSTNGDLSMERLLFDYPNLFTFATTNDLNSAQQSFASAVNLYTRASDLIRGRSTNVTRLFNFDPDMDETESRFRSIITELGRSLAGPVVLSENTNVVVELGKEFAYPTAPRDLLPDFSASAIIAGSFPDVTFGGILPAMTRSILETTLAKPHFIRGLSLPAARFVSRFSLPERLIDGRLRMHLDAVDHSFFEIQYSTDLQIWTHLTAAAVQDGALTFADAAGVGGNRRFYRAVERPDWLRVAGTVRQVPSEVPVSGASVTLSFPDTSVVAPVATTSSTGEFFVYGPFSGSQGHSRLTVSAPGFVAFAQDTYFDSSRDFQLPIYLAPSGFRPSNDDFAARKRLTGINVQAVGYNNGATHENDEGFIANGNSIWWSWSAPQDGAVSIHSSDSSLVISVYEGSSLATLKQIWTSTSGSGDSFFAMASTNYSVDVDTRSASLGRVAFNLDTVAATPPRITRNPVSQITTEGNYIYLSVSAEGTAPLTYLWQKNGVELGVEVESTIAFFPASAREKGVYEVTVRNAAGIAVSSRATLTINPGPRFFPTNAADFVGNIYYMTLANAQTGILTFSPANTYSFTPLGGAEQTGTFSNLTVQGAEWTMNVASDGGNTTLLDGELKVYFKGATAGSFAGGISYRAVNGLVEVPFAATANPGGTPGGETSIVGKTLKLSYLYADGQFAGSERFTFTNGTQASYEAGAETATYTRDAATGQFIIQRPGGQTYHLLIPPGTNAGNVTVVYQQAGGVPEIDPATYTMQ